VRLGLVLGGLLVLGGGRLLALRLRLPWRERVAWAQEVHLLDDHLVLGAARPILGLPLPVLELSCHRDQAALGQEARAVLRLAPGGSQFRRPLSGG
jgi:hypothetical protein